ncbi:MAG: protein DedD [Mesorhizobium sp.]|nr:MAG: protein DedD [Mesorhizobium sp.]RWQ64425.1 MAG: protein DedD [Mesorhizobium sp.]
MRLKDANRPDAAARPEEGRARAATDFRRPANERKTRQKSSRLSSSCVAPVTGRP